MTKKVFIGAGHGGSDPGAVANGLQEKALALDIALQLGKILTAAGVQVQLSREFDREDELSDKITCCNSFGPDLALDIHINAGGGMGFEVFHYSGGGTSKTLAANIEAEVKKFQSSRGLKVKLNAAGFDYFGFIRQTMAPAVILEAAFIDNQEDVKKINNAEGRLKFAKAYAAGILKTLGMPAVVDKEFNCGCTCGKCCCKK